MLRRARRHEKPDRRRMLLLAAGVAASALLLAVPALGLGSRVADLAGDILGAEEDFRRSHPPGDALPRTMYVHDVGPERISGRAPPPAVAALDPVRRRRECLGRARREWRLRVRDPERTRARAAGSHAGTTAR